MKKNQFIYTILFICSLCATSCTQNEEITITEGQSRLLINITDTGIYNGNPTRATTDANYKTHFEHGDQIGLYAIKAQRPIEGFNNVCLTYDEETKKWTASGNSLPYNEELEGATYYAYYPYNDNTSPEWEAEDPFAEIVNQWLISTEQSEKNYTQNDLMTGTGEVTKEGKDYTINLILNHRMAMVVIGFPIKTYQFKNEGMAPYQILSNNITFSLGEEEQKTPVTPYYDTTTNKYRLLIKPNTPYDIEGTFTFGSSEREFQISSTTGITEKTYALYTLTIDGKNEIIEDNYTLSIGDYYCADGSLISGSTKELTEKQKTNIIGIIYNIGTTDKIQTDYPNCKHGLVYALKRAERITTESDNTEYANEYLAKWGSSKGSLDGAEPAYTDYLARDENNVRGYEDTQYWLLASNEGNKAVNTFLTPCLKEYKVKAPRSTTNWYVPSFAEFKIIKNQETTLNTSLTKVGGEMILEGLNVIEKQYFWTSTLRSGQAVLLFDGTTTGQVGYIKSAYYYRFSLAF